MEDIIHRRCTLVHVKVGNEMQVVMVKNTNPKHHRKDPMPLPDGLSVFEFTPATTPSLAPDQKTFYDRVAAVDVSLVASIQLQYNTLFKVFDGLRYIDIDGKVIAMSYFKQPIKCANSSEPPIAIDQILLAGVFTADLDFLSKFLGHQGASARWLCMFCLAMQSQLKDTFVNGETGPRFAKRDMEHIREMYGKYQERFENLPSNMQTKERRKKITKEITHSIAVKALTDIPLDCITPATMHVILGLTKKIVDWILTLFTKLESLKEAKTKGVTTYHFRQRTAEAIEKVVEYEEFLLCEFVGLVQSVEGKKKEVQTLMERISQIEEMIVGQPRENHQMFWRVKLEELNEMSIQN